MKHEKKISPFNSQKQPSSGALFLEFGKIHRKTSVPEPRF